MSFLDFIARANPEYVESLYRQYRADPASIDERWALMFAGYEFAGRSDALEPQEPAPRVADLVEAYRNFGHLIADLDPLGHSPRSHPFLELQKFGFGADDLARTVSSGSVCGLTKAPLGELLGALHETYCGTLGVEVLDIRDNQQRDWLESRMESTRNRPELAPAERVRVLERLIAAETFEQFLHTKYVGQKRFSLEGGEALIPLLDTVVEEAGTSGVEEIVMGMPHRGRLNVLAHVLHKPYEMILAEFEGVFLPAGIQGDGDVKYHLGYSRDHTTRGGRRIHLSLCSNPSHLEAVDPVVEGIVRAKQGYLGDRERRRVVPVLMHGDAAFTGQGLVYETLALSELAAFTTGGTIHIIVDNQIGFTTSPREFRFTRYPSDLASVIEAPVFHVNADDPEAAVQAAQLAAAFRHRFRVDVVIDLVCYRRHGHNEVDDPTLTQPVMYREIARHPTVVARYAERLQQAGVIDARRVEQARGEVRGVLEDALSYARDFLPRQQVFALGGVWKGFTWAGSDWSADTRVGAARLRDAARALRRIPDGFTPHPRVRKLLDARHEMVESGRGIDWGCAETLAYATLLLEKTPVRLTGQDTARGTFSHRHAVLYDAEDGREHVPLNHLAAGQAEIEVVNSLLSEAGVLGFEYGMSSADPRRLVVWEAQFGDFANAAQVIIDQFIASAESKWQRMSGLVLLLPHGYEGQGPEHSSARLERFLQLCADQNLQVVNLTTPAQLFHALRRQMHRTFRKPLVVMSPKSLLRHPRAVSALEDFSERGFATVLGDPGDPPPLGVQRVLLCSGKIGYALDDEREERERSDVAIVRVEQLYPFPAAEIGVQLRRYANAVDVRWVQEEPKNQGAWPFVAPLLREVLGADRDLGYVGRDEAASPATGNYKAHEGEEVAILDEALKRPRPRSAGNGPRRADRAAG
ncbi:MAG: 2-oxoglutarate dehydrogenase E1 component [Deltaproteobacteria bacterium]|nr:2-oxoglutarate dehydrogenase E1 component [Deltaproteobacteria bacterium]